MVPCKEQAGNRKAERAIISYSQRLVLQTQTDVVPADAREARVESGDVGFVWPKSPLDSFGQNAQRSPALMLRSIAARPSAGPSDRRGALRCVSKHEGVCKGPSSSFETRARAFEFEEHFSRARSSGRGRASPAGAFFTISNSPSRSRARIAASGLCVFASLTPVEGWAERRETFGCSAEHPWACT
jgi:hypothetical protein